MCLTLIYKIKNTYFALVGYEVIITKMALRASLVITPYNPPLNFRARSFSKHITSESAAFALTSFQIFANGSTF